MKLIIPNPVRRAVLWLPALGLMLAPLAADARSRDGKMDSDGPADVGGRGGAIDEVNYGPLGMDAHKQRMERRSEGNAQLLSGRVLEVKGRTLFVEREGVVVPLDLSELRINKQPKPGQDVIASYTVDETRNVALSLAGEVAESQ
ncbi:hypothetical protein [Hyalangium versicolor]|uniref:hypothetical protein n=1 Tax=Hyalangium versicolor TaxID=2861190 RepID=UPI001CCFC4D9|nr:hypothetical protein [Hyalangium versicolor]